MNISQVSKKYIEKYMLDVIGDESFELKKRDNNTTYIYKSLYKDIQEAFLYVLELSENDCIKGILNTIKKPINLSNNFMTNEIKTYIQVYGKKQIQFNCSIFDKQVSITFIIFSNDNENLETYQKYAEYMYSWLYICIKYSSKKCANTLNIYIYHTPYNKTIPKKNTEILGTEHINSAYTTPCVKDGEIVIYRKEEWFKIFIHETMHIYGFDFSSYYPISLVNNVKEIFPINSDFELSETYSEIWARIINCAFISFLSLKPRENINKYLMYMDILIQIEKLFSLKQMVYVLDYMGLTYNDLYSKNNKSVILRDTMYRENTNVFCYYILTAMFIDDFQGFLSWCKNNNTIKDMKKGNYSSFIHFHYSDENIEDFGTYIKQIYKCNEFLNSIAYIEKQTRVKKDNTLRMSIVEFK
jgi:hypothetical protein